MELADGSFQERPYTPINFDVETGEIELMVQNWLWLASAEYLVLAFKWLVHNRIMAGVVYPLPLFKWFSPVVVVQLALRWKLAAGKAVSRGRSQSIALRSAAGSRQTGIARPDVGRLQLHS